MPVLRNAKSSGGATRMYDAGPVTTKLKPRKRPERKVVILENLDFAWKPSDMTRAAEMWQEGMPVPDMARELKRHDDEVLLLIVHLGRLGRIQARPGGILG